MLSSRGDLQVQTVITRNSQFAKLLYTMCVFLASLLTLRRTTLFCFPQTFYTLPVNVQEKGAVPRTTRPQPRLVNVNIHNRVRSNE